MTDSGPMPLRTRVEWAAQAARSVLQHPALYCLEVDVDPMREPTELVRCGFFQERLGGFRGHRLELCHVHVAERAGTATVTSSGSHPGRSYRRMAAAKEYPFPPRPLDLDGLVVEPADARAAVLDLVRLKSPVQPRCSGVALVIHDDTLVWRGIIDLHGHGLHTVTIDARTRVVVSDDYLPYGDA